MPCRSIEQAVFAPTTQRAHRALALQMLYAIDRSNYAITLDDVTERFLNNYGIALQPNAFSLKLVAAVLKNNQVSEEKIIAISKHWKSERIGCLTKLVIKIAMTEILDSINPAKIAIDQAIELAKDFCEADAYKFVNGVLDKFFKSLTPLS